MKQFSKTAAAILFATAIGVLIAFSVVNVVNLPARGVSDRQAGYDAGRLGQPPEACPYLHWPERENWMKGWLQGDAERRGAK